MLLTTRYPKFAATFISAVGLLICFAQHTWAQDPSPVDLNIVAHQDDDILFMNPDILNSVVAGHRQVTVYITAGNIGRSTLSDYSLEREEGAIAGYSKLLQLADLILGNDQYFSDITDQFHGDSIYPAGCFDTCLPCAAHDCELKTAGDARGQRITLRIPGSRPLNAATIGDGPDGPRVTLIFLRVDSECSVDNTPLPGCDPPANLAQLFQTSDPDLEIVSPFDQPGYTRHQLTQQLVHILQYYQPDVVRTQDPADGHTVDYSLSSTTTEIGLDSDRQHLGAVYPGITIYVDSTAEFPSSGVVDILATGVFHNGVDYTGTTPFTLTGCTGGSSSSIIYEGDLVTLAYHGEKINNLGCDGGMNFYDHTDHVWGARFAREALRRYDHLPNVKIPANYFTYYGYNLEWNENPDYLVDPSGQPAKNFCLKKSIFYRYALHDPYASLVTPTCVGFSGYSYENIGYQGFEAPPLP